MQLAGFSDVSEILSCGVYVLVCKGVVIYVGKAKAMYTRIYTHRNVYSAKRRKQVVPEWIKTRGIYFDEVHIQRCRPDELDALENRTINLYKPKYNIMLKTQDKIAIPVDLRIGGVTVTLNRAAPPPAPIERRV